MLEATDLYPKVGGQRRKALRHRPVLSGNS